MAKLKETYLLRPEMLIFLLIEQWKLGYIYGVIEDQPGKPESWDYEPHPYGDEKQQEAFVLQMAEDVLDKLKKRKDGTYYMPKQREGEDERGK